jgi:diaminopimelate decarboxylase
MFVRTLANIGGDVSTTEIQLAVVDLGYAIGNHLDTTEDPDATADYVMSLGRSRANANMWLAASVITLCLEPNHLTG